MSECRARARMTSHDVVGSGATTTTNDVIRRRLARGVARFIVTKVCVRGGPWFVHPHAR